MNEIAMVYENHLANVRAAMVAKQIDFLFLPVGPEFYYVTGAEAPVYHDRMRIWGDWIDGLLVGLDGDPAIIYHSGYGEPLAVKPLIRTRENFIMPDDDPDPDATVQRALDAFQADGKTIATVKSAWAQSVIALQKGAPTAHFTILDEAEWDAIHAAKDEHELGLMRAAAKMTVEIMDEIARFIKVGMRVVDIKAEMLEQMLRRGVTPSFPPGIGCVNRDSDPNVRWNPQEIIQPYGVIAFDFGVTYQGYNTDFGRSLFVKEALPDRLRAWSVLTGIIQDLTAMLGDARLTPVEIQAYGIQRAKENDFYDGDYGYYKWSIGHAIGTQVHEWPWLRPGHPSAHQPIRAGQVFCLEPKIFRWGQFYERIEDMVLVGKERGELLTPYPYEPVFVG